MNNEQWAMSNDNNHGKNVVYQNENSVFHLSMWKLECLWVRVKLVLIIIIIDKMKRYYFMFGSVVETMRKI